MSYNLCVFVPSGAVKDGGMRLQWVLRTRETQRVESETRCSTLLLLFGTWEYRHDWWGCAEVGFKLFLITLIYFIIKYTVIKGWIPNCNLCVDFPLCPTYIYFLYIYLELRAVVATYKLVISITSLPVGKKGSAHPRKSCAANNCLAPGLG